MGKEITVLEPLVVSCKNTTYSKFISDNNIPETAQIIDITDGALKELYEIAYPSRKDNFLEQQYRDFLLENKIDTESYGNWVYYDWLNKVIRIPPVVDLRLLRTARNQLLITRQEQEILFNKTILVAGMSVGSNVVEQLIHSGIGGSLILADMDTIEITNLNRIKTGLPDVTLPKVISSARKALELDPYLKITLLPEGVSQESLNLVTSNQRVDIFIDEVDDIAAKVILRQKAKELQIPVIMATDNSDGAIIDIERYDIYSDQIFFNDRIPAQILEQMISGELPREEAGKMIGKFFVGLDLVDNRLLKSLSEVRKSIPSWPQLGTAASMSGILSAYASRIILLGGKLKENRYVASFDKDMNLEYTSDEYKSERELILTFIENQP